MRQHNYSPPARLRHFPAWRPDRKIARVNGIVLLERRPHYALKSQQPVFKRKVRRFGQLEERIALRDGVLIEFEDDVARVAMFAIWVGDEVLRLEIVSAPIE